MIPIRTLHLFQNLVILFVGVFRIRALLFGFALPLAFGNFHVALGNFHVLNYQNFQGLVYKAMQDVYRQSKSAA